MDKMIRVLQVTGSLRVGGLENVAMNIFRFCDKNKYKFDFLVYGEKVEPFEQEVWSLGGRVFHIPYPHKGIRKYVKAMKKVMVENGPYDVVHSHSLFNSGFVMKAAYQTGIPIRISHAHSDRRNVKSKLPRAIFNDYMRFLINKYATKKFACSEGAGRYLYKDGYDDNVFKVKNGVFVSKFIYNEEARKRIKTEFNWESNKIIGHIGRLAPVKNQMKIINAFSYAYTKDSSLRLLIVGDGELRSQLQSRIDELGLGSVAILAGTRSDVSDLLSAFDVYVMASFYEGVSVSLIEAQSSGVQCLVTPKAAAQETRLTKCLSVIELEKSDEDWANKLIELSKCGRVDSASDEILSAGYDIVDIVSKELEFYEKT